MQRSAHVVIPGCLAALAAAEWLRSGVAGWAWATAVLGTAALAIALARERRARTVVAAATSLSLGIVLVVSEFEVERVECCWAVQRERRVTQAFRGLATTLSASVAEARRLAQQGARAGTLTREAAFDDLRAAMRQAPDREVRSFERGVAILSPRPEAEPWAWAGRHRFVPAMDSSELRAVITPFYVSLEARRQTAVGGTAVGSVLLDAAPAAPDRERIVSARLAQEHGVELHFFPPHLAPPGTDVFDFTVPAPRPDTLFSVQIVPPSQGNARLATLGAAVRIAGLLLAAAVLLLFFAAPPGRWRVVVALAGTWCLLRAPLGPSGRLAAFFSPVTFYRSLLGPFTSSAGSLTLFAALVLFAAAFVWRRGLERRWWSIGLAAMLLVAAPYLVRNLGRGITPPARGVGFALWLSWEVTLAVASMALILLAAALVRGSREPERVPWATSAACLWALLVAVAGLWLWEPNNAWPEWYTFLWLPALVGVVVPAPRHWAMMAIATVAGTAAALLTWGAAIEGRVALGDRDARGLGRESDPLAAAVLERLAPRIVAAAPPRTAGQLYSLWIASPLAQQDYPTELSIWTRAGDAEAGLSLGALDLPAPLVAAFVRSPATLQGARVERVEAVPGVHYVLIAPLSSGDVLAIAVGPRTRLLPSSRVARFLRGEGPAAPPYAISISPPVAAPPAGAAGSTGVVWTREQWSAHGERRLDLPGGLRHVHVSVDLRGPWPLLVRGALVVLVDVALLAGVWLVGVIMAQGITLELPGTIAALRSSYRFRLAAALAAFLVVPVLAFAAWSFARLRDEVRDTRDLLIRQTLKDAAVAAAGFPVDRPDALERAVLELGSRLDADLWLYRGGVLQATSTSVLAELGLIDGYLSPRVFRPLALEDNLEMTADGRSAGRPIRVGYRVVAAGPPASQAILAAPQLLDEETLRQRQEDLALTIVLAVCLGLGAASYLARLASSALARPVAVLRHAADAVGRGALPPAFPERALREFEPVMTAFQRMAADVRTSQHALEEARHRTAQVLANVATGVIAVERDLRVTLANGRAAELVGAALDPGDLLPQVTAAEWLPVWSAVREFLEQTGDGVGIVEREFAVGARHIRAQIASLGPAPDGCVIALDDATAVTRAARVLAWGEMARQVAHEIKNPLTPIRLGIQHLQRVRKHENFDATLRDTATRILAEIDRLDAIARTFSRFGSPAAESPPLEAVDLYGLAREVVQLYTLGGVGGGTATRFHFSGTGGEPVLARRDEVKEVLVNLLENSRSGGARDVTVRVSEGRAVSVEDDGRGIAPDVLPRVFEPTFSTTSSGAGLGLAIAKRLVESWGGTIGITSTQGVGTTVTIALAPHSAPQGT